ncbi:telomere length regulation protein TEL2 homolog [Leptopilina heterotoma]|uniref:telomere length regulation protein TEL2 homolog n=1 Tax=Leptopilina heterotoma TaxID=63436 RepID=UPI001CA932B3|nr:telomere length regulation protein TEL2 homolog [Leptopilina heterotoma]
MMNMWKVRELMDKATNVVMNYTETEAKVREATNDDAWGPTGAMMQELAQATFTYEQFPEVMSMLWKRMLQENKRNWRRTYKALLLLNYLVRNGSERVVTSSREHIYDLKSFENYTYIDEFGKDQGINIRHKVRELIDFIQDDDKLRDERKKAKKNKDKYVGMSSEAMGMRWTDNPKWNKPNQDTYNDWDRESRAKGFEDANNSDDGEREDSDNDVRSSPRRVARKEYKDTIENIDRIGKIPSSISSNPSPSRASRPIKKVDLGAAANYGKDQSNLTQGNLMTSPVKQQKSTNNILNELFESNNENLSSNIENNVDDDDDDFNPRANTGSTIPSQNVNTSDFGDFTSAFGNSTNKVKDNDEFADFTSAFNSGMTIQSPATQLPGAISISQQSDNLSGTMIPGVQTNVSPFGNLESGNVSLQNTNLMGNNMFNSLPPQGIQSWNNGNNNTASNTDLLSDLGGFNTPGMMSPASQTNNANNANLLNSMSPLISNSTVSRREDRQLRKRDINYSADLLLEFLQSMEFIKSHENLEKLKALIDEFCRYLPGSLTPQKYLNLDETIEIDSILYGKVLEKLVEKFNHNWPLTNNILDSSIENIFIIDGSTDVLFYESIFNLMNALKETDNEWKILTLSRILESLLKSDALLSAIVYSSKSSDELQEETWKNIVQLLVSLPNRVANKAQKKMLDSLTPKLYAKIVIFHLSRAILFLNDGLFYDAKKPNVKIIAELLGKMFLVMESNDLYSFIDILSVCALENRNNIKSFIETIFVQVDRRSVESIVLLVLKNCKSNQTVKNIFSNLANNPMWKYIFTTKVPLMSWHSDENLMRNLISYLNNFTTILVELLLKLLNVWGDRSAISHTPFEQHLYITKLIILSVRSLKDRLSPTEKEAVKKLLYSAIVPHFESTQILITTIGMITGEIIGEIVNEKDSPKLEFEYDSLNQEAKSLVQEIRNLKVCPQVEEKLPTENNLHLDNIEFTFLGARKIYDLAIECKIITSATDLSLNKTQNEEIPKRMVKINKIDENINKKEDEEIDSDDDLVPYDMSNDPLDCEKFKPVYLRDMRDNLTSTESNQNPDIFSESVKIAEELILTQLPNDDISFGLELLEIFVTLGENYHVDDFESLKFRACVAIVTVFPKESAEYLCREFYTKAECHSINQRINFLEILADSVRKLSNYKIMEVKKENKEPKKPRPSKPISLFIETTGGKKHETLFDDDFEVPRNRDNVNWEEIVQKRIDGKTKRFAHSAKKSQTVMNKFANVATYFFYPLLYGFGRQANYVYNLQVKSDSDNILLVSFLKTLATIMIEAKNCPSCVKMAREIIDLVWTLRYHNEAKVRFCAIENIAAVLTVVSEESLINELLEPLMEIRLWLIDSTQKVVGGEPDTNCKKFGSQILALINSILGSLS